jgi:hypothetical protein
VTISEPEKAAIADNTTAPGGDGSRLYARQQTDGRSTF